MSSEWVEIGSYTSDIDAWVARDILAANGIESQTRADGSPVYVSLRVRLVVREEDAELARELIAPSDEVPEEPEEGEVLQEPEDDWAGRD